MTKQKPSAIDTLVENCCNILETLTRDDLLIKEYKFWVLYLRGRVKTLGSSALITKQHKETMSALSQEEISELSVITKEFEKVLNETEAFKPDKYNYQMNMMKENHTHFNIFPRYSSDRVYAGVVFKDPGWPQLVSDTLEIDQDIQDVMAKELRVRFDSKRK